MRGNRLLLRPIALILIGALVAQGSILVLGIFGHAPLSRSDIGVESSAGPTELTQPVPGQIQGSAGTQGVTSNSQTPADGHRELRHKTGEVRASNGVTESSDMRESSKGISLSAVLGHPQPPLVTLTQP